MKSATSQSPRSAEFRERDPATHEQRRLRLLLVEDSADDVDLIVAHLRRQNFEIELKLARNETEFLCALDTAPDVVVADRALPHFDGMRALALQQQTCPGIPFILLSGHVTEDMVGNCMRQGAFGCLSKDRLSSLGPAIQRALSRREAKQAAAGVQRRAQETAHGSGDSATISFATDGTLLGWNEAATRLFGHAAEEMIGTSFHRLLPAEAVAETERHLLGLHQRNSAVEYETTCIGRDGSTIPVAVTLSPLVRAAGTQAMAAVIRDLRGRVSDQNASGGPDALSALFAELASEAGNAAPVDATLHACLDIVSRRMTWAACHLVTFNPDDKEMVSLSSTWIARPSGAGSEYAEAYISNFSYADEAGELTGEALRTKQPLWVADLTLLKPTPRTEILINQGLRSGLIVPVVRDDRVIALLEIYFSQGRPPGFPP